MAQGTDRCPAESDGQHRWTHAQPPEWMADQLSEWDEAQWEDFFDGAEQTCYSCGITLDG